MEMIRPQTVIPAFLLLLTAEIIDISSGECGGELDGAYGAFQSPMYPEQYPPNSNCTWTITVPEDYVVSIEFTKLDIEENRKCRHDYVALYEGATLDPAARKRKVCGEFNYNNPGVLVSSSNVMTVSFVSDGTKEGNGFNATYGSLEYDQYMTEDSGTFHTPTHPDKYPHNANFTWTITVAEGYYVELEFIKFHLEGGTTCPFDLVSVYNGQSIDPVMLLGKYCGSKKPPIIQSWTNSMFIQFISDSSWAGFGFKANYTSKTSGCVEEALISGSKYQVEDSQLTASSSWGGWDHGPWRSLLNTEEDSIGAGAWCVAQSDMSQWIQVDLTKAANVTSIATQGRNSSTGKTLQWVKSYTVQYSLDGQQWATYSNPPGIEKVFDGNSDRDTMVEHNFTNPIYARFVRLRPRQWNTHISLRWQLYGCLVPDCVEGALISQDKNQTLTASSYWGNFDHRPHRSRLTTIEIRRKAAGAWCAAKSRLNEWIQVTFTKAHNISSVLTRGRNSAFQWVTSYTLQYRQDGQNWTSYREQGSEKVFRGNMDRDTPVMHHLTSPIIAKYVRLYPISWKQHISLRWELFTCAGRIPPRRSTTSKPSTVTTLGRANQSAGLTPAAIKQGRPQVNPLAVALPLVIIVLIALFLTAYIFRGRIRKVWSEGDPWRLKILENMPET